MVMLLRPRWAKVLCSEDRWIKQKATEKSGWRGDRSPMFVARQWLFTPSFSCLIYFQDTLLPFPNQVLEFMCLNLFHRSLVWGKLQAWAFKMHSLKNGCFILEKVHFWWNIWHYYIVMSFLNQKWKEKKQYVCYFTIYFTFVLPINLAIAKR